MGFGGWRRATSKFAFFFSFIPAIAFANDWYSEIASQYEHASIPKNQSLGVEKAWSGKCSSPGARHSRTPSLLYVHVDRDPLSGPLYQVVVLNKPETMVSLEKARIAAREMLIAATNQDAGLKHSDQEKAWVMRLGNGTNSQTLLVRESTPVGNDPAFFVQSIDGNGTRVFCYYYQPLVD